MAQIGLNITITGLSGFLIIRWLKASAPLAEVGRNDNPSTEAFPYDDVYVIPDLSPVVYIVQLWRSDDGIALDQLIKDWSIDASQDSSTATINTYQYVVDRGFTNVTESTGDQVWADPADQDVILTDERLDGFSKDELIVHEAGFGNKLNSEYDLVAGGGIELLGGKTFDSGVAWFITTTATSSDTLPDTSAGAKYAGVEEMSADHDFDEDHRNKLIITNGAGTVLIETFPDLALIPDDTHVTFNTHKGSQNYLVLQFDAGDTVRFMNQDVNIIYLAKCETISLYFHSGVCYVVAYDGNALRRGTVLPDYDASRDTDRDNLIYADESTGELDKADYEGLYAFVLQLSGDAVCNLGSALGEWSYDSGGSVFPNKRKFGIDTGAETFRVPHLSGMVAKYSATPGVYEADAVKAHTHVLQYKIGKSDDNESGVSSQYMRELGAAGGTNYGDDSTTTDSTGGSENLVKSYSQKPFIYL